jgi:hypothetical protein
MVQKVRRHGGHRVDFAKIIVERAGGFWKDRIRAYQIEVDGEGMGAVKEWETCTVSVPAGLHRIQMTLDFAVRSREVAIEVEEGETVHFVCAAGRLKDFPSTSGWIKLWQGSLGAPPPRGPDVERDSIDWDSP